MTKFAEVDFNRKLVLERGLLLSMRAIFTDMANQSTNEGFTSLNHENNIRTVFADHYIKVMNSFITDYRNKNGVSMDSLQEIIMVRDLVELVEIRASDQAKIITNTSAKQKANVTKIISGFTIPPNDIQRARQSIFFGLLMRRISAIACSETQWSAETAKFTEVVHLAAESGIAVKKKSDTTKRWDTQGDDLMRRWHSDADAQVKPLNEPFIVKGQKLMRPGDTSLGATASNIVNCRCASFYAISERILTFVRRPSFALLRLLPSLAKVTA